MSPLTAILFNSGNFPTLGKLALNIASRVQKTFPRSNTARRAFHSVRNWYEGGWPIWSGGETSYLPSLVQDARFDQNYVTRREMLRRMRYWSQNSELVESILSVGERFTVGTSGLPVSFYPSEEVLNTAGADDIEDEWYSNAEAAMEKWFASCGWNGESMFDLLKIAYRGQKIDGDVFILKTRKKMPLDLGSRIINVPQPVLQIVEGHRCESPWNKFEEEDKTLIDGVQYAQIDTDGRQLLSRIGFWIRSGSSSFETNDSWTLVKDTDCWQIRNVHRADQPRSVSDFYACEVNLNKLEDLIDIEMGAQRTQSVRAVAYENAAGTAANLGDKRIGAAFAAMGQKPAPNNSEAELHKRFEMYRKETGAYVYGIKPGEKIHFDSPVRPSDATLNLWECLTNYICAAAHAPRCLVMEKISAGSARGQGTEIRAQLDSSDNYYQGDFQKWKKFVREAVVWRMEWEVKNNPLLADPPANWRDCIHIHQPASCNVDIGYNTQAMLTMLAAGAMDYDMILGPQGTSSSTVFKRLARQQRMIEKLKIKVTLPALLPGQIPLNGDSKGQQQSEAVNA